MITAYILTAVVSASLSTPDDGVRPCSREDGAGPRDHPVCVWDAKHMDNGKGDLSMIITDGEGPNADYREVYHRRAHSLIVTWCDDHPRFRRCHVVN